MEEDEEDAVSPRTLAAAVARLAAYTSEEPVGEWEWVSGRKACWKGRDARQGLGGCGCSKLRGACTCCLGLPWLVGVQPGACAGGLMSPHVRTAMTCPPVLPRLPNRLILSLPPLAAGPLPHQQYADLYHEAGADGVGAMGSEPACTLFTFSLAQDSSGAQQEQQPEATAGGSQAAEQQAGPTLLRLVHTLSCQPHKLLTCHLEQPAPGAQEPPTPDTHLAGGGGDGGAPGALIGGSRLLLGLTDDVDCAVVAISCSTAGGEEAAVGFVMQHVTSIPALAYVTAGASSWFTASVLCA